MNFFFYLLLVLFIISVNDIEAAFNSSEIQILNGNYNVSLNGNSSATDEERNFATDILKKVVKVAVKLGKGLLALCGKCFAIQ
uniref:Uncharacterized protein n=1 Tax=Ditylenchus dipsaci TaxID=166011 RepID=A0A915E3E1_9BILA